MAANFMKAEKKLKASYLTEYKFLHVPHYREHYCLRKKKEADGLGLGNRYFELKDYANGAKAYERALEIDDTMTDIKEKLESARNKYRDVRS